MHYHYLTIEQRQALEALIRSTVRGESALKDALAKLHQPDYGVCIECRADIGFDLLQADPSALHCRRCTHMPVRGKS
jgi:RNA polymerase-binding transcription factor DksA